MTKQLRKRLYGPEIWIADNTVPSLSIFAFEGVSTIPAREVPRKMSYRLGSGETIFIIEDIVSTYMKIYD